MSAKARKRASLATVLGLGLLQRGDVDAGADEAGELPVGAGEGLALVEHPAVLAVAPAEAVLHREGPAGIERRGVDLQAAGEVLGMDVLGPADAEFRLHRPADEVEPGLVAPGAALVRAGDPDQDRGVVGGLAEAGLAGTDGLGGVVPLGDVGHDAGEDPTAAIVDHPALVADPDDRAVGPQQAVLLVVVGPLVDGMADGRGDAVAVLGVDVAEELLQRRGRLDRGQAEDPVECGVPGVEPRPEVEPPGADRAGPQGHLEPLLAVDRAALGPVAGQGVGDEVGHGDQEVRVVLAEVAVRPGSAPPGRRRGFALRRRSGSSGR